MQIPWRVFIKYIILYDQKLNQWCLLDLLKFRKLPPFLHKGWLNCRTAAVVVASRSRLSPQKRTNNRNTHTSQMPRYLNSLTVRSTDKYSTTHATPSALDIHRFYIKIIHTYFVFIWVRRHGSSLPSSSKTAKMATIITWPQILWRTSNVKGTKRPVAFVIYNHVTRYTCTSNESLSQE